jgi:hypothetical protein
MRRCAAIFALPLLVTGSTVSAEETTEPSEPSANTPSSPLEIPTGAGAPASTQAECDAQHVVCFQACWEAEPPLSLEKRDAGHYRYCASECLGKYVDCLSRAAVLKTFDSLQSATEWLSQHPEVDVGTLVGVAGAAFVVATGSAGSRILLSMEA